MPPGIGKCATNVPKISKYIPQHDVDTERPFISQAPAPRDDEACRV